MEEIPVDYDRIKNLLGLNETKVSPKWTAALRQSIEEQYRADFKDAVFTLLEKDWLINQDDKPKTRKRDPYRQMTDLLFMNRGTASNWRNNKQEMKWENVFVALARLEAGTIRIGEMAIRDGKEAMLFGFARAIAKWSNTDRIDGFSMDRSACVLCLFLMMSRFVELVGAVADFRSSDKARHARGLEALEVLANAIQKELKDRWGYPFDVSGRLLIAYCTPVATAAESRKTGDPNFELSGSWLHFLFTYLVGSFKTHKYWFDDALEV